ncbi:hypothetical protein COY28_02905 [Candidatus Woesearchaeota archaeon CG_4_10_14_0_2_um_filter_57_5]|nr:MAG: hypothetical protein AUJ68_03705 [Candidatus Woesearchaeota archaeon CG1_02_57_44]PIN69851.1 MAG: hypothetical protein COV94_02455 [Candidatus Woesearchaeota archaeon CG11_big_fil_rev_8_21_14_0_20_57_5]PIZ54092.1 MAG: hypothetical protein COY28_02905 [Candidatus Woesearchaeota archaeon CG_4_10_14_0_2_um_filter_57_5]
MKLTKTRLLETLRAKNDGLSSWQARKVAGVSVRRVNQVWSAYLSSGVMPEVGRRVGRPRRLVLESEIMMVRDAWLKYRVSASMLEALIERDYGVHIPHNHIHKVLVQLGLAKPLKVKVKRKIDWVRYERKHSLTAVHLDWHLYSLSNVWVLPVVDDASRMLLALIETSRATTEASIMAMQEALTFGRIRQCITDHGTQFTKSHGSCRFGQFLARHDITSSTSNAELNTHNQTAR